MLDLPKKGRTCGEVATVILPGAKAACAACALREIAKRRKLNQAAVAEELEVTRETVNRVMRRKRAVGPKLKRKLQTWVMAHV